MSKSIDVQQETDIIMEICQKLSEEGQLRVAVFESIKGTAITGGMTLLGALLGGGPGMLLGGAVGSATAYALKAPGFVSVSTIIRQKMTAEQKTKLASRVRNLIGSSNMKNAAGGMLKIASQGNLKESIKKEMANFIQNEFGKLVFSN